MRLRRMQTLESSSPGRVDHVQSLCPDATPFFAHAVLRSRRRTRTSRAPAHPSHASVGCGPRTSTGSIDRQMHTQRRPGKEGLKQRTCPDPGARARLEADYRRRWSPQGCSPPAGSPVSTRNLSSEADNRRLET